MASEALVVSQAIAYSKMRIKQGCRNDFGIGGGGKIYFFSITLFFQKDTILFISITVISNIDWAINIF